MKNDKDFITKTRLRKALTHALENYSKGTKAKPSVEYGIDYNAIIEYLKPFPKDIESYHVDHIIPLSWFNFNNPQEIKWAFAPENHQWLTKEENIEKGNKYIYVKCLENQ